MRRCVEGEAISARGSRQRGRGGTSRTAYRRDRNAAFARPCEAVAHNPPLARPPVALRARPPYNDPSAKAAPPRASERQRPLGNRLTVDPRTLTPLVLVRIQVPQPPLPRSFGHVRPRTSDLAFLALEWCGNGWNGRRPCGEEGDGPQAARDVHAMVDTDGRSLMNTASVVNSHGGVALSGWAIAFGHPSLLAILRALPRGQGRSRTSGRLRFHHHGRGGRRRFRKTRVRRTAPPLGVRAHLCPALRAVTVSSSSSSPASMRRPTTNRRIPGATPLQLRRTARGLVAVAHAWRRAGDTLGSA